MKIISSLITIGLLTTTLTAHAQDENVIIQKYPQAVIYEGSSEHNRLNKKFTVDAQLFGASGGVIESALIAGYHLDRNSIIQIEAGQGNANSDLSTSKFNSSNVGAYYKKFVGNSFYVKSGVNYRTVDFRHRWLSLFDSTYTEDYSFQGNYVGLNLLIGNQWNWENFTMGCDWIGYTLPVASNITSEKINDKYLATRDSMQNYEDTYLKNGIAQGLKFYLGYTF